MATCPECDAAIEIPGDDLEDMDLGDRWECLECTSQLRLSSLDPVEFEPDDDDDDDDDAADETDGVRSSSRSPSAGDGLDEVDGDEDDSDDDEGDWD